MARTTDFLQGCFLCNYNLVTCWAKTCAKLGFGYAFLTKLGASPVAQMVENLPAVWETRVQSLGRKDPLEKGMATHSSIPAWRILWTEGHSLWGCKESDTTEQLTLMFLAKLIGPCFLYQVRDVQLCLSLERVEATVGF